MSSIWCRPSSSDGRRTWSRRAACGTGVVTRLLAERVGPTGAVVGLDINPEMPAVARRAAPQPNIEWVEGSAVGMALPDATFDQVLCEQGLQFFPDSTGFSGEMPRH
jgi:ubiquinone/menaquinone biosynthesis C-methylase UbiE